MSLNTLEMLHAALEDSAYVSKVHTTAHLNYIYVKGPLMIQDEQQIH